MSTQATFALPALPMPSAGGNLDSYIHSVSRFPFLTQEQETGYARAFRDKGDLEAARAGGVTPARGCRDGARLHGLRPAAIRLDSGRQHRSDESSEAL